MSGTEVLFNKEDDKHYLYITVSYGKSCDRIVVQKQLSSQPIDL